jgi:hypothetical protein
MAKKFQTAVPGALFGADHMISFLLVHFYLLYASLILFSSAELIAEEMLMTGLLTHVVEPTDVDCRTFSGARRQPLT